MARSPTRIAIIGGLGRVDEDKKEAAKQAARDLGAELARAGLGLVVYHSLDHVLEPHVVSGYVPALPKGKGSIIVRYASRQKGEVRFAEEAGAPRTLFDYKPFPGDDWEAPFYRSLVEEEMVDAVLLLGGGSSTLAAGQIAIARNLPILAVDSYGGAANTIWNQLSAQNPSAHLQSYSQHRVSEHVATLKDQCAAAETRRRTAAADRARLARMRSQGNHLLFAVAAFALLVATLVVGIAVPRFILGYVAVIIAGLVSAGATGAMTRLVLYGDIEKGPTFSLFLGAVAGILVGLAYLIPQWMGAPAVLAIDGHEVSATERVQFASSLVVAFGAGMGFDTIFRRIRAQADSAPINPPAR